jgi:hypothetical protein
MVSIICMLLNLYNGVYLIETLMNIYAAVQLEEQEHIIIYEIGLRYKIIMTPAIKENSFLC